MDTPEARRYADAVVATINGERKALRINIDVLAERAGINYSTLRRLLANQMDRDIGTGELAAIASVLGLTVGQLSAKAEDLMPRLLPAEDDALIESSGLSERGKAALKREVASTRSAPSSTARNDVEFRNASRGESK